MKLKLPTLLFALFTISVQSMAQNCWNLVWSDEFNGSSLNTADWSYETGNGCPNLCGWGNSEKEYYTNSSQNVTVSGGNLNLVARYNANYAGSGYNFTSGKINTKYKQSFKYGRFEANMKLPSGTGTWPAFWMLSSSAAYGSWPTTGEIDIMENRGDQTTKVDGTLHYGSSYPNNQHDGTNYTLPSGGNVSNAFHLYAVEWEPTQIRWYVDGILYKTETKSPNSLNPGSNNAVTWPWDQEFYILLNLAVGGTYAGSPSDAAVGGSGWSATMLVDYVRVYTDISAATINGSIAGETTIQANESNVAYSIAATSSATYNWTVTGGTIASGQGTNAVIINWGSTGGNVSVIKTISCNNHTYSLPVTIQSVCGTMLEDFENIHMNNYSLVNGDLTLKTVNPASSAVNATPFCAKYVRNASQQYDVIISMNPTIGNADLIKNSSKKFKMDVYSNAAGRNVQITLENSATNSSAYPTGRHSYYTAVTTKANQWETLTFNWGGNPDASVAGTSVDQLTLLFETNSNTGYTYYYDNFLLTGTCPSLPTATTEAAASNALTIFPNPAGETISIQFNNPSEEKIKVQIMESTGKVISENDYSSGTDLSIGVSDLKAGYYLIKVSNGNYTSVKAFFKK